MRRDGRPAGSAACSEPVRGGPMTTAVAFDKRILKELAAVVGRDYVLHDPVDLKVFEYDGTIARAMPQIVVLPETAEQVSEVVKLARRYGLPVTPRGAGTGLSGGAIAATRAVLRARPGQPARLHGGRQRGGERRRAPLPGLRRYHEPHPRPGARPGRRGGRLGEGGGGGGAGHGGYLPRPGSGGGARGRGRARTRPPLGRSQGGHRRPGTAH